jgi:hypothetical protein
MAHHSVAFSVGYQYVAQLTNRFDLAMQVGFGNWVETGVCDYPAVMGSQMVYGRETGRLTGPPVEDWNLLARQRLTTRQATAPADLLKADLLKSDRLAMSQPVYAERWALVGLLNQQPAKFGKLLLAIKESDSDVAPAELRRGWRRSGLLTLKESDSDLAAIEKVYGWNEKELDRQWRAYVMKLGKKKAAGKRD